MLTEATSWAAVVLAGATATGILLARDWRWELGFMALQYVAAAALARLHWPVGMAAAMLVTGWMSISALGMTLTNLGVPAAASKGAWPEGRPFRLFMAGMIVVLAAGAGGRGVQTAVGIEPPVLAGAILLAGIGALQLGSTSQTARIVLGLLTVLSGFEIFYAGVEGSILVAGLLSVVILGLGLIGSYLLSAEVPEEPG